jgi:hypothetical protein
MFVNSKLELVEKEAGSEVEGSEGGILLEVDISANSVEELASEDKIAGSEDEVEVRTWEADSELISSETELLRATDSTAEEGETPRLDTKGAEVNWVLEAPSDEVMSRVDVDGTNARLEDDSKTTVRIVVVARLVVACVLEISSKELEGKVVDAGAWDDSVAAAVGGLSWIVDDISGLIEITELDKIDSVEKLDERKGSVLDMTGAVVAWLLDISMIVDDDSAGVFCEVEIKVLEGSEVDGDDSERTWVDVGIAEGLSFKKLLEGSEGADDVSEIGWLEVETADDRFLFKELLEGSKVDENDDPEITSVKVGIADEEISLKKLLDGCNVDDGDSKMAWLVAGTLDEGFSFRKLLDAWTSVLDAWTVVADENIWLEPSKADEDTSPGEIVDANDCVLDIWAGADDGTSLELPRADDEIPGRELTDTEIGVLNDSAAEESTELSTMDEETSAWRLVEVNSVLDSCGAVEDNNWLGLSTNEEAVGSTREVGVVVIDSSEITKDEENEAGGVKEKPGPSVTIDRDTNAEVLVGIIDELNTSVMPSNVDVTSDTLDELGTDEEAIAKVLDRPSDKISDELTRISEVLSDVGKLVAPSNTLDERIWEGSNDCIDVAASCEETIVRLVGASLVELDASGANVEDAGASRLEETIIELLATPEVRLVKSIKVVEIGTSGIDVLSITGELEVEEIAPDSDRLSEMAEEAGEAGEEKILDGAALDCGTDSSDADRDFVVEIVSDGAREVWSCCELVAEKLTMPLPGGMPLSSELMAAADDKVELVKELPSTIVEMSELAERPKEDVAGKPSERLSDANEDDIGLSVEVSVELSELTGLEERAALDIPDDSRDSPDELIVRGAEFKLLVIEAERPMLSDATNDDEATSADVLEAAALIGRLDITGSALEAPEALGSTLKLSDSSMLADTDSDNSSDTVADAVTIDAELLPKSVLSGAEVISEELRVVSALEPGIERLRDSIPDDGAKLEDGMPTGVLLNETDDSRAVLNPEEEPMIVTDVSLETVVGSTKLEVVAPGPEENGTERILDDGIVRMLDGSPVKVEAALEKALVVDCSVEIVLLSLPEGPALAIVEDSKLTLFSGELDEAEDTVSSEETLADADTPFETALDSDTGVDDNAFDGTGTVLMSISEVSGAVPLVTMGDEKGEVSGARLPTLLVSAAVWTDASEELLCAWLAAVVGREATVDSGWTEVSMAPDVRDDWNISLSVVDGNAEVIVLLNSLSINVDKSGLLLANSAEEEAARLGLVVKTMGSEVDDSKPPVIKEVPVTRLLPGGIPLPSALDSSVDEVTGLSEDENAVRILDSPGTWEEITRVLDASVENGAPLLPKKLDERPTLTELTLDDDGCSKELTIVSDGDAWKEVIEAAEERGIMSLVLIDDDSKAETSGPDEVAAISGLLVIEDSIEDWEPSIELDGAARRVLDAGPTITSELAEEETASILERFDWVTTDDSPAPGIEVEIPSETLNTADDDGLGAIEIVPRLLLKVNVAEGSAAVLSTLDRIDGGVLETKGFEEVSIGTDADETPLLLCDSTGRVEDWPSLVWAV